MNSLVFYSLGQRDERQIEVQGVSKYQPKIHNTNNKKRRPQNVRNTNRPYQNTNRPYQNTNRPYQNTYGPYQNTNLVGIMIIGILTVGILIPTRTIS